jgi:hypothetical protein
VPPKPAPSPSKLHLASNQAIAALTGGLVVFPVNRGVFPLPKRSVTVTVASPDFEDAALVKREPFPKAKSYRARHPSVFTGHRADNIPNSGAAMLQFTWPAGVRQTCGRS